jgi:hypothetical protein
MQGENAYIDRRRQLHPPVPPGVLYSAPVMTRLLLLGERDLPL